MKKSTIFIILSSALVLTSCLDETAKDRLSEDQAYSSASSLYINAVASLYNYIGGDEESEGLQGTYRGVYDYNEITTDEAIIPIRGGDWYDGGYWQNLYTHNWDASNESLYNTWKYLYKVVVLCNESLEALSSHGMLLTTEQYQAYCAEVRALRAIYYYYIMDLWGNVPMAAETAKGTPAQQYSRSKMFAFIWDELQECAPLLPDANSNQKNEYYGRVTRPVAYFVLAKLALNAEVYTDDNWTDGTRPSGKDIVLSVGGTMMNAWDACITYCDKISTEGYTLATDYSANFAILNESSPENIWTIPMDKTNDTRQFKYLFRSRHYAHGGYLSSASENGTCATIYACHIYGYGTDSVDTRWAKNFYSDTLKINGNVVPQEDGTPLIYYPLAVEVNLTYSPYILTAGARMNKYETDFTAYNDGNDVDNDIVLFRYADVLLMKAEAEVRNGGNGDKELNLVRRRAGMPARTATLNNILQERLLELCWEGWRRQDMIRFDRYHVSYDLRTAPAEEADRHTIVFPIPQRALDLNTSLKQNSGYK